MNIALLVAVVVLVVLRLLYAVSSSVQHVIDGAIQTLYRRVQRFIPTYKALLREAKDPSTSAARLSSLALSPHPEVLQAIAQNPNSPPAVLMALSEAFPREIFENSALTLILLEDPVFLTKLSERALLFFLSPFEVGGCWELLVQHESSTVRGAVAEHPEAPNHLKKVLLFDPDMSVRCLAREALSLSPEVLRLLIGVGWYDACDTEDELLVDPPLTAEELQQLAELFPLAAKNIALHPNISQELLQKFSTSEDPLLRSYVARHPQTSFELLEVFSSDTNAGVVMSVIQNEKTPESLLERLANQDPLLQRYIPQDRKLSEAFLRKLSQSSDEQVLSGILASLEVPEEIVTALLRILPNYGNLLLYAVMSNPSYHTMVEKLATEDPDPEVRAGLQRSMQHWLELQAQSSRRGWRGTVRRSLSERSGGILPRVWR
jgi:hypothetical protein